MSQSNEALWNLVNQALTNPFKNIEDLNLLNKIIVDNLPETYEPEPDYISEDELIL